MNNRILIFTFGTKNLKYQYELTNKNKTDYALNNGYEYQFIEIEESDKSTNPKHFKIAHLIEFIESGKYDYVMFMDCDTWFNNFNMKLDDIIDENKDSILICANDQGYRKYPENETPRDDFRKLINSGVLLFKSCGESLDMIKLWKTYLNDVELNRRLGKNLFNGMYDQPRLSALLLFNPQYREKTAILNARFFNCLPQCGKPNDESIFIFHAAGVNYQKNREEMFADRFIKFTSNNSKYIQ